MTGTIDLATLTLAKGAHGTREDGVCLLEAVAWFAGQAHTDHPPCVSPVLAAFGRNLNDILPDGKRQELVPLVPLLPGTASDGHDETRGYLALDWLVRTYAPAFLDLAPVTDGNSECQASAAALRDLPPINSLHNAQIAAPQLKQARDRARAAWDALWDASWDAAGAASWDAAWDAAGDAVRAAAGAAAGDAARAAAGDAVRAAAGDAAGDAAWDAAWDAAGAAAGDAAGDALAPTVAVLQDSAIGLYRAMITPGGAS